MCSFTFPGISIGKKLKAFNYMFCLRWYYYKIFIDNEAFDRVVVTTGKYRYNTFIGSLLART